MGEARRKPTVLVADDSPIVAMLVSEIVAEAGGQVLGPAGDGTSALQLFEDHRPDAALLDISMPGLTGLEILQRIRSRPQGDRCLVIVMTSHDEPAFREQALADGADHFLHKATGFDSLHSVLRQEFGDLSGA